MDIATIIMLIVATALAAGGGIGGGGLLVPIYSIVGGFPTTQATALSLATISGGSIANLYTYTQRYHPNPTLRRPLIDYNASLLFCPALLAGTMFGGLFSVMFPPWLVVICLVVLLGYSGKRTVKKGIAKWNAESAKQKKLSDEEGEMELVDKSPMADAEEKAGGDEETAVAALEDVPLGVENPLKPGLTEAQSVRLTTIREAESRLCQWSNWGYTSLLWGLVLGFAILRGGRGGESAIPGLECGDGLYWGLFVVNLAILLVATYFLRIRTLNAAEEKAALGHEPLEGDLAWDKKTTAVYPALCVFAGVAAGLLGIGGGMVLGPLLVELGCLPQPIAATSAYVVFITATAGLAQVTILGLLPGDYALLFSCFGVFATFLGQTAVDYVVKKYKKDAIVILVIGAIMIIALVLMAYNGIMQMIYAENYGFSPLC